MILTFLLTAASFWLGLILQVLPVGGLPDSAIAGVLYFWSAINAFSYIFPVGTFLSVLVILWILDNIMLGFRIIMWVFHKIPFIGK